MNQVEAITMEELTALTASSDRVYMQSLMVRERLLGPGHKDTLFGLMYRGAVYADSHSYQRCVDLWKYAFNLHHCLNERVTQGGLHTLQTLCKLFLEINEEHSGGFTNEAVRYEDVSSIFNTICDDVEAIFLCRMNCIQQTASEEEFQTLAQNSTIIEYKLQRGGRSLAASLSNGSPDFVRQKRILLECGADVNASDDRKDTPLHLCSKLKKIVAPTELAKLAEVLIASGAHLDARNKRGKLASDGLTQLPLQLRPLDHVTLKCLAARMIKIRKIAYEGEVPESLHKFIELH
ncbi:hypothetical protein CAPTEDRAFT_211376 [Capitella teleta]|uniref:Uncharacterized protein n=1 Tax=Capitella teleta TaxID=283909 RepID=R7U3K6_CAPTE|nr:hypothetical protein CAPTEDRAFT_211376 [Capitella teleta]|eukprot:ELU00554.1 hypothetical protein CAPTEDRAFT_211376 [Capitella teleta]